MIRRSLPIAIVLALATICSLTLVNPALAVIYNPGANYYTEDAGVGGPTAALYPSPRPTPPWVGHTFVTYQPLMPHEFLYPHSRVYVRPNPCGSVTRTSVTWGHSLIDWGAWRHPRQITVPARLGWCYPCK